MEGGGRHGAREYEERRRLQEQRAREYHHHVELYRQHFMPYGYPMEPQWGTMPPMEGYTVYPPQQPQQHIEYTEYQPPHPLQHPGIMQGVPLPPGIPGLGGSTDPLEAVLGPFPCAQLKNLPYDASLEDILVLFQGLVVIDVIIVGNGEAFVIFANPMDFQMALQRDRQPLGRQFVEISAASRDEYYSAIAKQHMQEQEGGRLLAASVGAGTAGKEGGGEEQQTSLGETASAAAAALWGGAAGSPPMLTSTGSYGDPMAPQHLGHNPQLAGVGGRGGGGGPSRGGGLHAPMQKRTGGGIQVGEHTGFLRMRGLPFSAAKDDIYKFFQGYNPVQESIVLTYRNDGRATGEAYIGFASPEDSKRAMDLHRRSMGSRYIELFISNKDEQGRALARFGNR